MNHEDAPFEIHVHGDVKIRPEVGLEALQEALRPLWQYAGAATLADGAESLYEEEPGLRFDAINRVLQMCWTVRGGEDFRLQLDDLCMNLNDISDEGVFAHGGIRRLAVAQRVAANSPCVVVHMREDGFRCPAIGIRLYRDSRPRHELDNCPA